MISADRALWLILVLLTIWTTFSGLVLLFFPGSAEATIGGGQGEGAQRLLGVHVLVLAPIYGLLAWKRERYQTFLWIPYVVQSAVVTVTVLNMVTGDIDFVDGLLPLTVAATFLTLLIFVWRAGRLDIVPESELLSRFTSDDAAEEPVIEIEASVEAEEPANEDDSTPTPV
jgi:hypothetical protein